MKRKRRKTVTAEEIVKGRKKVDDILEFLLDGESHSVADITSRVGFPKEKVLAILRCLSQYNFVSFNGDVAVINSVLREIALSLEDEDSQ